MGDGGRFIAQTCGGDSCKKELTMKTTQLKFGCDAYTQTDDFKRKASTTKLNRYGHSNYRGRAKNFCQDRLWNMIGRWSQYVVPAFKRQDYLGLEFSYKWTCQLCGREFESTIHSTRHINGHIYDRMPRCFHCFPRNRGTSNQEKEFIEFCKTYCPNLKTNDKSLIGKELDIVIPELHLAIEYNGLYWHSTSYPKFK